MSEEIQTLPRNKMLPRDRYDFRIKSAKFEISKAKGNKMLNFQVEIYAPEQVNLNSGGTYSVAGLSCIKRVMLQTDENVHEVNEILMPRLGLPAITDTDNPDTEQFVGKCFSDIAKSVKREQRKDPTAEQLALGQPGDVIIDHETGQPEVFYGIDTEFGLQNVKRPLKVLSVA